MYQFNFWIMISWTLTYTLGLKSACHEYQSFINIFAQQFGIYIHIIGSTSWPKKKELWIPPIWGCWGPTGDSFFTHEQIKHPAFFEGRWYTGKIICQIWAEWAVCLDSYLWKGWMFYLLIGKKLTSSRSTTTPDRWYQKFFLFGRLALPMMCRRTVNWLLSIFKKSVQN